VSKRKVTVVGAGNVGATAAFSLATRGAADVVLVDVAEGTAQGKALDMMHARSVLRFGGTVTGSNGYAETAGSDVVVITAGVPRRPGMTRDELLAVNAGIVRSVVVAAVAASPDAVLLCVTNPLDVMTQLAWQLSGLPSARVLGMGGVLDSARFAYFIARETGAPVSAVDALVIGAHGDAMVPLPRLSTVAGTPVTELLPPERVAEVVRRTVFGHDPSELRPARGPVRHLGRVHVRARGARGRGRQAGPGARARRRRARGCPCQRRRHRRGVRRSW
jgi:malate dehydrogenase